VAGAERLFAVTRDWSITIASGCCSRKTSLIRVLLPEPATPVTTVSTPVGMLTVTSFRLCRVALLMVIRPVGRRTSRLIGRCCFRDWR
jgi:hypothetical protein